MKGVILAGGKGSRLEKLTSVVNKHLVPVGNFPMIEYPLSTLEKMKINDITIVTGTEHLDTIIKYLTKEHPSMDFTYKVQKTPSGIAKALSLVENVSNDSKLAVILGDNIFEDNFSKYLNEFEKSDYGAMLFLKKVKDPERFGVVELDSEGKPFEIIEKPEIPKSNLAVTGLYLYNKTVFDKIRRLRPSARGEYEITDVNDMYLKEGMLTTRIVRGFWSDAGTLKSRKVADEYALEHSKKFDFKLIDTKNND